MSYVEYEHSENPVTDYWNYLEAIDPRLRECITACDDEMVSGRLYVLAEARGAMQYALIRVSKDEEDFVHLWKQFRARFGEGSTSDHEHEAREYWGVASLVAYKILTVVGNQEEMPEFLKGMSKVYPVSLPF